MEFKVFEDKPAEIEFSLPNGVAARVQETSSASFAFLRLALPDGVVRGFVLREDIQELGKALAKVKVSKAVVAQRKEQPREVKRVLEQLEKCEGGAQFLDAHLTNAGADCVANMDPASFNAMRRAMSKLPPKQPKLPKEPTPPAE